MFSSIVFAVFILLASKMANAASFSQAASRLSTGDVTPAELIQMGALPNCSTATQFPDECRTAKQAAPFINQAFCDYNISSNGERAALLSLILFESGGFEYNMNHFPAPGRPGQGTRNMMMFPFIFQYALDTPSVALQAQALAGTNDVNDIPSDTQNAIRALVLPDHLSFASAMWFYTKSGDSKTGCTATPGMVDGLRLATLAGWEEYITNCIFTTVTPERQALYEKTLVILSAKTSG
ncbi:hypothetical protein B0H14DRAFT_2436161 [Mycena olivaceomarginata]|nr:hypothetical protein B0H14DRAFT_2436161 [Mycena olivaceomarginata]